MAFEELVDEVAEERVAAENERRGPIDSAQVLAIVNAIRSARRLRPLSALDLGGVSRDPTKCAPAKWVDGAVYPGNDQGGSGALSFPTRKEAKSVAAALERFDPSYPRSSPFQNVQYQGWYIDLPRELDRVARDIDEGILKPEALIVAPIEEPARLGGGDGPLDDFETAAALRRWVEARVRGGKVARKRAHSVVGQFGWQRLSKSVRRSANELLLTVGVKADPSLLNCERDDWLRLTVIGEPIISTATPTQLIAYHSHNWAGGDMGHYGQWLRCLKNTKLGDRQLIWSGEAIAGVVTFGGWVSEAYKGVYEGWGSISRFVAPLTHAKLLDDPRTRARFDGNGIKALQGNSINLDQKTAAAVAELLPLGVTRIPLDEPDPDEEPIYWTGLDGFVPEVVIEAAVASRKSLWRRLGFRSAPSRQRRLGDAGRVDLIAGDVVGEAKRAVTLRDGPDQIERYLWYLEDVEGRSKAETKGILLQCAQKASPAVIDRIKSSEFRLELWSVHTTGKSRRWKLGRLA
jgi:hypothetical protein